MGDSVDLKSSENASSDNGDVVSSSSETTASRNENMEDNVKVSNSDEIPASSSDAVEVAVTCTEEVEVSTSNLDACVSSSSDHLLPKEDSAEEPDSTDSVVKIGSCKDDVDDADLVVSGSSDDILDDSPDLSDSAVGTSCRDIVDDGIDSLDSILDASFRDGVGESSLPYESIMDVCSSAAEQIKRTITEALKSRESVGEKFVDSDDFCISLEANLKEKIADFEKTVEKTNSPTKESGESSLSSSRISSEQSGDSCNSEIPQTELDTKKTTETTSESSDDTPVPANATYTETISSVPVQKLNSELAESKSVSSNEVTVIPEVSTDNEKSKKNQKSITVKKKGEKSVDQILKSLSNCSSPEEKLQSLCRKHIDVLEDMRCSETRLKQCERQAVVTLREKEQLQAEHNRTILAKSRLESLCRELQRQNKAVKEESLLRIREEEEKRKDVANKFQMTLNDISNLMQDNSKKNLQLREENTELAKKLKSLVEHYEMWEKHMGKVLQQKDLEVQLAKAKLAKTNLQLKQETEKFLREKKDLLENMSELQKKCTELASNEVQLRTELSIYTSKYEEFQTVLNKSNQVFASFKTDMDTTSKKIKKLEKETNLWKTKWENSNGALLEMIADKQKRDKELLNAQQRVLMLEKLCRALQGERNDLQNQVKELLNKDGTVSNSEEIATVQ